VLDTLIRSSFIIANGWLANARWVPYRARALGGPLNTLVGAPLRRRLLCALVAQHPAAATHDITILVPLRGRVDSRIYNCLNSIRAQTYSRDLVKIIVIDYDNDSETSGRLEALCRAFDCQRIVVPDIGDWNKPHCVNIGIRAVRTRYIMTVDVDIMLDAEYVGCAVKVLRDNPLAIVVSALRDLPEVLSVELAECASNGCMPNLLRLRAMSEKRAGHDYHISLQAACAAFYNLIHGYDEYYRLWGPEDQDMFRRLQYLGLRPVNISDRSFYLHQWHPKYEGVQGPSLERTIALNNEYFLRNHTIARNRDEWGMVASAAAQSGHEAGKRREDERAE
jgi:glycosyltransferase involved in cell wall biosynthesis